MSLARQLHSLEHKRNKTVRAEQWISKSAKAMDIEIDEDLYPKESAIYVHCTLYLVLILKARHLTKVALPFNLPGLDLPEQAMGWLPLR